eukprot:5445717-Alexandrium_andersonii.AAC.1
MVPPRFPGRLSGVKPTDGGGRDEAIRSFGAGRNDERARPLLSPSPTTAGPEEHVFQAAKRARGPVRRPARDRSGGTTYYEPPPDVYVLRSDGPCWSYDADFADLLEQAAVVSQ